MSLKEKIDEVLAKCKSLDVEDFTITVRLYAPFEEIKSTIPNAKHNLNGDRIMVAYTDCPSNISLWVYSEEKFKQELTVI
jgi:hypothetical protein